MVAIMKVAITGSEAKVLRYLALNGPDTGYNMGKEVDISLKTAYTAPKILVDRELVSVSVVGKTRSGQDMKEYSLTVLGLATALLYPQVNENMHDVIRSWGPLLTLVLGKWDVFVNAGVKDLAKHRLMNAAVVLVRASQSLEWEFAWHPPKDTAEIFRYNFYLSDTLFHDHEKRLKWARACAKDPEIRDYLIRELTMNIERYKKMMRESKIMMEVLKDEKDASPL
ncbi:hypothetical protein ES708_19429 [subsurface metagenome]